MNILTQIRHKLANALLGNTLPTIENWEENNQPNSAYPIIMRTGQTTITDEYGETTTYPQTTTIIQEPPTGPCYTATATHNGEIIGWHLNPIAITTE